MQEEESKSNKLTYKEISSIHKKAAIVRLIELHTMDELRGLIGDKINDNESIGRYIDKLYTRDELKELLMKKN